MCAVLWVPPLGNGMEAILIAFFGAFLAVRTREELQQVSDWNVSTVRTRLVELRVGSDFQKKDADASRSRG